MSPALFLYHDQTKTVQENKTVGHCPLWTTMWKSSATYYEIEYYYYKENSISWPSYLYQEFNTSSTFESLSLHSTMLIDWTRKKDMILSIDTEKSFDKIQHPLTIKKKSHNSKNRKEFSQSYQGY